MERLNDKNQKARFHVAEAPESWNITARGLCSFDAADSCVAKQISQPFSKQQPKMAMLPKSRVRLAPLRGRAT